MGHVPSPHATRARAPVTTNNFIFSSTTHSSFYQYCISHKTISHRAAAAPGPEVRLECPMTKLTALPLLATNPGDATGLKTWLVYKSFPRNFSNHRTDFVDFIRLPLFGLPAHHFLGFLFQGYFLISRVRQSWLDSFLVHARQIFA